MLSLKVNGFEKLRDMVTPREVPFIDGVVEDADVMTGNRAGASTGSGLYLKLKGRKGTLFYAGFTGCVNAGESVRVHTDNSDWVNVQAVGIQVYEKDVMFITSEEKVLRRYRQPGFNFVD